MNLEKIISLVMENEQEYEKMKSDINKIASIASELHLLDPETANYKDRISISTSIIFDLAWNLSNKMK